MTDVSREMSPASEPRPSVRPALPPRTPGFRLSTGIASFVEHMGGIGILTVRTIRALPRRPFEIRATIYQIEALGVRSVGIVVVSSVFVGMVMTVQFAYGLQRFGGIEYIPRVVMLAFLRELGPTLMAIIVGGRIGSGIAAEVGSMNVTEQVEAIRALGGDPAKKLVLPRVLAAMIVLPLLSIMSDTLGTLGALLVTAAEYNIGPMLFLQSSLEVVTLSDLFSGLAKTPIFGFIISIVGCYFGLSTTGGTEGVGRSTTRTVVAVSIAILVADFFLTRIFVSVRSG